MAIKKHAQKHQDHDIRYGIGTDDAPVGTDRGQ